MDNITQTQNTTRATSASLPFQKVAEFHDAQVTGVTVSDTGRIFACFPRWRENIPFSVVEIDARGNPIPYPNEAWNSWTGQPAPERFTCIQSVIAHGNSLYVLDPSNPMMKGVVGHPRLFEFDLTTNQLKKVWEFDETVAPKKSYLNDLRVDDENQRIYITDSGIGGIVIVDVKTNEIKRVLDKLRSTRAEVTMLTIKGKPFLHHLLPVRMHSDGIEFHDGYLYFHALTGFHLYRISAHALMENYLDDCTLETRIEKLGETPAPDGMCFDRYGNLYMADLEQGAIVYRTPDGVIETLVQHEAIGWADTFSIKDDELYFTDSHLIDAQPGEPTNGLTTQIYKMSLPEVVRH